MSEENDKSIESVEESVEDVDIMDAGDIYHQLAALIKQHGSRVSALDWATILADNAESITGISSEVLIERTNEISDAAKAHKVVVHKLHFTVYANQVRDNLIASGLVKRRANPVIVNANKAAISMLLKEPLSKEFAKHIVDAMLPDISTRLSNLLTSYLQRARKVSEIEDYLYDQEFAEVIEDSLNIAYKKFVDSNWDYMLLDPKKTEEELL